MALNAIFKADFSSFYDAVTKAQVKLVDLSEGANKVGSTLDKMTRDFSGQKVIQQAHLMTAAMVHVGGTSALTEKELRKLAGVVGEAADKMKRMGMDVPPGFQKITQAAKDLDPPTRNWGTTLFNLTNLVRGFLALQVVQYFKAAAAAGLEWASSLTNLRAKTELTYRDLQILEDVGLQTGVSVESLAKAIQVLQQRIGDGTARKGIQELGLSFDAIKKMSAGDMFVAIATELHKIKDPTDFATAAAKIFGMQWRENAPAIKANIAAIARDVKFIGDAQIEAADRGQARWTKFWNDQKKGWAGWVGDLLLNLDKGMKSFDDAARRGAAARASLAGAVGVLPTLPNAPAPRTGLNAFVNSVDPASISTLKILGQTLDEQTRAADRAVKSANAYREAMIKLQEATIPLTAAEKAKVDLWNKSNHAAGTMADALGVSERAVQNYLEAVKTLNREIPVTNAGMADFEKLATSDQLRSGLSQIQADILAVTGTFGQWIIAMEKSSERFPDWTGSLSEWTAAWHKTNVGIKESLPLMVKLKDVAKSSIGGLNDIFQRAFEGGGGVIGAVKSFATNAVKELTNMIPVVGPIISQFSGAIVAGFSKIFGGTAGRDAIRKFADSFKGGFDGLHKELGELGAAGEQLWITLTQGVGRNDSKAAAAAIKAVENALDSHKTKVKEDEEALKKHEAAMKDSTDEIKRGVDEYKALSGQYVSIQDRLSDLVTIGPSVSAALGAALNATDAETYKEALDNINAALDAQTEDAKFLQTTMDKYKITWKDLGQEAKNAKVAEITRDITREFDALKKAGVDTNLIMDKMGPSINKFLHEARKTGAEVPESFRRIIEEAIKAGEVFDKDGKKIKDITQLGLTFGTSLQDVMKDASKSMADSIAKLVDIIEKKLAPAIKNIPDGDFTVKGKFIPPKIPKGYDADWDDVVFAEQGFMGRVTKPTLFMAGEGGSEDVSITPTNKRSGSNDSIVLNFEALKEELQALRRDQARDRRSLPHVLVTAWKDALAH